MKRTPSLQNAFDDARYYLDTEATSRRALLQRMGSNVGYTYSEAEALYVVNHVDADWKAEAVESAKNRLENQGLSKRYLMNALIFADGFSKAEATYAVSRIGRDWNAEAVEKAKHRLEDQGLSPKRLMAFLIFADGFSKAEATYAVSRISRIGRDWNAEAVEAAKEILEAKALSKSQLIRRLKRGGFTDAQVRHAVEKVY